MVRLHIDVGGVTAVDRYLARFQQRATLETDLGDITDALAADLAEANKQNFDTEGAAGAYGRWAALSPRYRAWKALHYPGKPILVRTGALRDSLTRLPLGVQSSGRGVIELGTRVPYAQYHQTGGGRLPRRAPVALTEQTKRDLTRTLQRWIVSGNAP